MSSSNGSPEDFSSPISSFSWPLSPSVSCKKKSSQSSLNRKIWTSFSTVSPKLVSQTQSKSGFQITTGTWSNVLSRFQGSWPSQITWSPMLQVDSKIGSMPLTQKQRTYHSNGKLLRIFHSRNSSFSDVSDQTESPSLWPTSSERLCHTVTHSVIWMEQIHSLTFLRTLSMLSSTTHQFQFSSFCPKVQIQLRMCWTSVKNWDSWKPTKSTSRFHSVPRWKSKLSLSWTNPSKRVCGSCSKISISCLSSWPISRNSSKKSHRPSEPVTPTSVSSCPPNHQARFQSVFWINLSNSPTSHLVVSEPTCRELGASSQMWMSLTTKMSNWRAFCSHCVTSIPVLLREKDSVKKDGIWVMISLWVTSEIRQLSFISILTNCNLVMCHGMIWDTFSVRLCTVATLSTIGTDVCVMPIKSNSWTTPWSRTN